MGKKDVADGGAQQPEHTCDDLLYRVSARNLLETNVKVKLRFHPICSAPAIDLAWPCGGIKDFLPPGPECTLLTLRRRNAFGSSPG